MVIEFTQLSRQDVSAELGKTAKTAQKGEAGEGGETAESSSFFELLESAMKKNDLETVIGQIKEKIRSGELDAEKLDAEKKLFDKISLKQLKQLIEKVKNKDADALAAETADGEKTHEQGKAEKREQKFLGISVKDLHAIHGTAAGGTGPGKTAGSAVEGPGSGTGKNALETRGNEHGADMTHKAVSDKNSTEGTKIIYLEVSDKEKAGNLGELDKLKENMRGRRAEAGESTGKKGGRTMAVTVVDKRGEGNGESAGFKNTQVGLNSHTGSNGNDNGLGKGEFNPSEQFSFDLKTENTTSRQGVVTRGAVTGEEQSHLLKFLKGSANGEIVKQAGIILKKDNSGEIRLVLKPEKLGNVRIKLNLQDNNIVGKIIVENINVKEVFEHNLESLHRAFRQEGFQSSGLEVSVGGGEQKGEGKEEAKSFAGRNAGHEIGDDHSPAVQQYYGYEEGIVNLVV